MTTPTTSYTVEAVAEAIRYGMGDAVVVALPADYEHAADHAIKAMRANPEPWLVKALKDVRRSLIPADVLEAVQAL